MTENTYQFPDEYSKPKTKEKDPYGLQYAQAMYHASSRVGYRMMAEDAAHEALNDLAQGRSSTSNIRRMFGFHERRAENPGIDASGITTNDDNGALAYVDIQTVNLATKYINRAVAKIQRSKYHCALSAVDPLSVDEAKQKNSQIQTFYQMRGWFNENHFKNEDIQKYFPGLDIVNLPEYPEELVFRLSVNDKIQRVIDGEKTLKLVHTIMNDTDQEMRMADWDAAVVGHEHLHCYLDENMMPRVKHINAKYWGSSYVDNEDFRGAEYQFFIEFITRNQFKKEAENKLSEEDINTIISSYTFPNAATSFGSIPNFYEYYDGLEYIPVMRFYFLSNDNVAYATWENDKGHRLIDERHYEYYPKESDKKQRIIQNTYTSVYGGSWVVDSKIVYNYGRKDIPRTNIVNSRLPIISFAPNMKNGKYVSLLSQCVEPLVMFNVAWNKAKDVLAKGRIGILELNLTAFENIALGKGGDNWSPQQAIDFLFQSQTAATRQTTSPYGQNMGQAVKFHQTGVTLADYFQTMAQCVRILDDLTGSSVIESPDLPDRLAVGTMKANIAAGSDSMEYLHNAHKQMYEQASHMLLLLTQEAKRNKTTIEGMIPALGKNTTEFFTVPDDLGYCEYGMSLEREPSPEEWALFYQELQDAVAKGKLNASDTAFIRDIDNMKMARFVMANREVLNEKKAVATMLQNQQFQAKSQEDASRQKLALIDYEVKKKRENDEELMVLQAQIDSKLLEKEAQLKSATEGVGHMVKEQIAKQSGVDSVIKEAIRAKSERYKSDKQHDAKVITAGIQARAQLTAAEFVANKKEKAPVKKK